jgi:hypothetical protein
MHRWPNGRKISGCTREFSGEGVTRDWVPIIRVRNFPAVSYLCLVDMTCATRRGVLRSVFLLIRSILWTFDPVLYFLA